MILWVCVVSKKFFQRVFRNETPSFLWCFDRIEGTSRFCLDQLRFDELRARGDIAVFQRISFCEFGMPTDLVDGVFRAYANV